MNVDQFMGMIAGPESGGDYGATNSRTGASGKFQILPSNWPSWSREAGLPAGSAMTPANQNTVARFKLQQYYDTFGSWAAVAVAWYAGPDDAAVWLKNPHDARFNVKQGNGNEPSINEYVTSVLGSNPSTGGGTMTAATAQTTTKLTPQSSPADIEAYIRKTYPDLGAWLANPEIKAVLFDAAVNDLDETEVEARIRQTSYWQSHGPASRQFDLLIGEDGKAAGDLVDTAKSTISDMFARNGITATDDQVGYAAKQAIRAGWISLQGNVANPAKLNDFTAFVLGRSGKPDQPLHGEVGQSANDLGATARQYGITLSQATLNDWALKLLQGSATADSYKEYLTSMARGIWQNDPEVLRALDEGRTPMSFFDPYREQIARTLELSPDQVDVFGDPRWREVTQHYDPSMNGGKGGTRAMTLGEAAQMARNQPGYTKTSEYRQSNANFALKIAQKFGGIG